MSGDSDLQPSHEGEEPRDEFAEAVDSSYGRSPVGASDREVVGKRAEAGPPECRKPSGARRCTICKRAEAYHASMEAHR